MAIRRTVFYSGRVQGVGFRATACRYAARFQVTGNVRNLPDGRVEMEVEGEVDEVDRFCEALESGMKSFIADRQASNAPATGEFSGFRTRY